MSTADKGSPSVVKVKTPKKNFPVCTGVYAKCDLCLIFELKLQSKWSAVAVGIKLYIYSYKGLSLLLKERAMEKVVEDLQMCSRIMSYCQIAKIFAENL